MLKLNSDKTQLMIWSRQNKNDESKDAGVNKIQSESIKIGEDTITPVDNNIGHNYSKINAL